MTSAVSVQAQIMSTEGIGVNSSPFYLSFFFFGRVDPINPQYKRDAVDAAVREIEQDREAFAEGRREALKRIGM